jgi:hypothetical protein
MAYRICKREDLFVTEMGRRLSRALAAAWDEVGADAGPEVLIGSIADDSDRELFAAVLMLEGPTLDEKELLDVRERLERRRDEIALKYAAVEGGKSDEDLLRIDARLKELKGEKPLEKSLAEGLDIQHDPFV